MTLEVIILAAGKGTRMRSALPKVLHDLAGRPLIQHVLDTARELSPDRIHVVHGHGAELVRERLAAAEEINWVEQAEQLGTGHALAQASEALAGFEGDIVVLYADTPFISAATMSAIKEKRHRSDLVVLGFHAQDPAKYGRLVTEGEDLTRIVEFKDANETERAITLCNSGVMAGPAALLLSLVAHLKNDNASGEYYLTDCIALAKDQGHSAQVVICEESETLGVNSRHDLAQAEAIFQDRMRAYFLEAGVNMFAPETVYFSHDTVIGRDAVIEQNVIFAPNCTVESGAIIRAFSHLEGAHVSRGAVVGPYARLRPGAEISEEGKIGNFVEIKNAQIGEGAKVNHLSYVGDATVGQGANIGAGAVTCNYDGVMKHHTDIGENAFIGSSTMMVAPVTIGKNAMTASGSVITKNVPDDALALGRADQNNKLGMARKLMELLKKRKLKRDAN